MNQLERIKIHIKNTRDSIEKLNAEINQIRNSIKEFVDNKNKIQENFRLIRIFETEKFDIFFKEISLLVNITDVKLRKLNQNKEKLEFCKLMEDEIIREKLTDQTLRNS